MAELSDVSCDCNRDGASMIPLPYNRACTIPVIQRPISLAHAVSIRIYNKATA